MLPSTGNLWLLAAVRRAQEAVIGPLMAAGATAPERAIPLDQAQRRGAGGRFDRKVFDELRRHGIVCEASGGLYWFNAAANAAHEGRVRRKLTVLAGMVGLAIIALMVLIVNLR